MKTRKYLGPLPTSLPEIITKPSMKVLGISDDLVIGLTSSYTSTGRIVWCPCTSQLLDIDAKRYIIYYNKNVQKCSAAPRSQMLRTINNKKDPTMLQRRMSGILGLLYILTVSRSHEKFTPSLCCVFYFFLHHQFYHRIEL